MMKRIALLTTILCVCSIVWTGCSQDPILEKTEVTAPRQEMRHTAKDAAVDPIFEKTEATALKQELRRNDKDAAVLVELIRKSIESRQVEAAYETLDELRREQPNNAVVLAAYAMAYDAALYQVRKSTGIIRERTAQEDREYKSALQRAKEIDPKLWLPYTLEGFRLGYATDADFDGALDLLHKAVELSPGSAFAHKQFAEILDAAAINKVKWNDKAVTHEQAAEQYEIALKLDPDSADVAFALFSIYDLDLKDREAATRAKRAFLKTLPPGYNIKKSIRKRLARYPD